MHVFGPVPSRRLGLSLGVDPIPPKTCNFSCIYCQLGRTTNFINERRAFYPKEEILGEIGKSIEKRPDYITFVGSGEPTLSADLGWLIRRARNFSVPVAVITNGALLSREDVRDDLGEADIVLPSLDAGCPKTFRRVNRPVRSIVFEEMVDGLIDFSDVYGGKIWVEYMALNGINDSRDELLKIAEILREVGADRVHVNVPIRPPAEPWVEPSANLSEIEEILGEVVEIVLPEMGDFPISSGPGLESEIAQKLIEIMGRHPMRRDQIAEILKREKLGWDLIDGLVVEGRIKEVKYREGSFFVLAERDS